jgi:hypothetical protein
MSKSISEALADHLDLKPGENLYAVVDGAQDLELAYEAKILANADIQSLFEGESADGMADVAPYFFQINTKCDFLKNWSRRWGRNAGILFVSKFGADEIRRHLRGIFVVTDEEAQEFFFRFYDPRVIRSYLPTCKPEDLVEFFGRIDRFLVEDEELTFAVTYHNTENGLRTDRLDVPPADPDAEL